MADTREGETEGLVAGIDGDLPNDGNASNEQVYLDALSRYLADRADSVRRNEPIQLRHRLVAEDLRKGDTKDNRPWLGGRGAYLGRVIDKALGRLLSWYHNLRDSWRVDGSA